MAMSRSFGGTRLTTRSPMRISPDVMFSSPAIMRRSVDLPHPEGPTRTTNSPSPMSTSTPWITSVAPKAFLTSQIATDATGAPPLGPFRPPFDRSRRALLLACHPAPSCLAARAGAYNWTGLSAQFQFPVRCNSQIARAASDGIDPASNSTLAPEGTTGGYDDDDQA